MTPEEIAEARYRAMAKPEMSEDELETLWDEVWTAVERESIGGRLAPMLGRDSASVVRDLANPDSVDAFERRLAEPGTAQASQAAAPPKMPSALTFLERLMVGGQQGARDVIGRNALGLVRSADNLTGGGIGPLNALRARTDRTQRDWDREEEALAPHRGKAGLAAQLGANLLGEGAAFMTGGRALSALSPRYKALYEAGEKTRGLRGAGMRGMAGLPINAAQGAVEKYGNDVGTGEVAAFHLGGGAVGDAFLPPAFRRLGSYFGGLGDGAKILARGAEAPAPRAPSAPPQKPRTMDDILDGLELRDDLPPMRQPDAGAFDLRDDLDFMFPPRSPRSPFRN